MKFKSIEITTNIGCKNMCSYCPQKSLIGEYKKFSSENMMSMDVFKNIMSRIPRRMQVTFGGFSEPFLNKSTVEMIDYSYSVGHPVQVYTTLVGLDKSDVDILELIRFDRFTVHIPNVNDHFMDEDEYLLILDIVCKKINNLEFIYFGDVSEKIFKVIHDNGHKYFSGTMISRSGLLYKSKFYKGHGFCETKQINIHEVLPDGTVVLCCMDFGLKHKLGNLNVDSFKDLHMGKVWKDVHKNMKDESSFVICRNCEFFIPFMSVRYFSHLVNVVMLKMGYNHFRRVLE